MFYFKIKFYAALLFFMIASINNIYIGSLFITGISSIYFYEKRDKDSGLCLALSVGISLFMIILKHI